MKIREVETDRPRLFSLLTDKPAAVEDDLSKLDQSAYMTIDFSAACLTSGLNPARYVTEYGRRRMICSLQCGIFAMAKNRETLHHGSSPSFRLLRSHYSTIQSRNGNLAPRPSVACIAFFSPWIMHTWLDFKPSPFHPAFSCITSPQNVRK
jgi:hypothetical protein